MPSSLRVMLVGATGLVGGHCLTQLLADDTFTEVVVPSRRALPLEHPKLTVQILDFAKLREHPELFQVDMVICCLGTTRRKAGSRSAFRQVDYGYTRDVAELAMQQRVRCFILVSALGANSQSTFFYNRIKGRAEWAVRTLSFRTVHLVRPSLLLGKRRERRRREGLARWWLRLLSPVLLGPLRRFRPVEAERVAGLLVHLARSEELGQHVHYPSQHNGAVRERRG